MKKITIKPELSTTKGAFVNIEQELIDRIAADFYERIMSRSSNHAPELKRLFLLATIGLPGSGRTTVAKKVVEKIPGTVLVSANSGRYLINRGMGTKVGHKIGWGENLRRVLKATAILFLENGYSVIFDGNAADPEDRDNIEDIVAPYGAQALYLKVHVDAETAKERERIKYENPNWVSSFEEYRVNSTTKMIENIDERAGAYAKVGRIPGLIGVINNNGPIEQLRGKIEALVKLIMAK